MHLLSFLFTFFYLQAPPRDLAFSNKVNYPDINVFYSAEICFCIHTVPLPTHTSLYAEGRFTLR